MASGFRPVQAKTGRQSTQEDTVNPLNGHTYMFALAHGHHAITGKVVERPKHESGTVAVLGSIVGTGLKEELLIINLAHVVHYREVVERARPHYDPRVDYPERFTDGPI